MTRVCMLVYHYYYRDSRVRRYAEGLAASGVDVDVLCLREPGQSQEPSRPGVRLITVPAARRAGGISDFLLAFGPGLILFSVFLLALYLRHRYEVIHVHNMPDSLVLAALLPRLLGAKVILDIHDPMPEFFRSKYSGQSHTRTVDALQAQERLCCAAAHAVITANANFRDNLTDRGVPVDKIFVIRNLPDLKVFDRKAYADQRPDSRYITLIYAGTIAPRYGIHVAVQAMPTILASAPATRLILIGAGQPAYLVALNEMAQSLGIVDAVRLLPPVPVNEVPRQLAQADVGIYPALPDAHMTIATPSKVMEYAAMGLPILASQLQVLEDMFGDAAVRFIRPGDPDSFAEGVLELALSPARRRELVEHADQVFMRRCNWCDEFQEYEDLLRTLLAKKIRPGFGTKTKKRKAKEVV